ncbi:hypothetical protein SNE40_020185 [Patella caerulea]|uniref:Essential MCU regulator, mitochondrial n=1 Tax=Patella caerulea TaxID=87958 RepID=A0AAN8G2A8_PATCE
MAARLTTLSIAALSKRVLDPKKLQSIKSVVPARTVVYSETGAVIAKPEVTRLGITKVLSVVFPFVTLGGYFSREFATLLEEHEIFAPDDDDD